MRENGWQFQFFKPLSSCDRLKGSFVKQMFNLISLFIYNCFREMVSRMMIWRPQSKLRTPYKPRFGQCSQVAAVKSSCLQVSPSRCLLHSLLGMCELVLCGVLGLWLSVRMRYKHPYTHTNTCHSHELTSHRILCYLHWFIHLFATNICWVSTMCQA